MNLQTKIPLEKAAKQIDYDDQLLLLGSCFVENIGEKFDYFKFQSLQNPFGILFNPLAIETLISKAIKKKSYSKDDIFFQNERWHCYDAHSDLSNASQEKLLENLNRGLTQTREQLEKATHIIITLGTAWVYSTIGSGAVVANCHKVPQVEFKKELLSPEMISKSLENTVKAIKSVNENVQFIFTVSPVRHLKDGFVENQRSKAHLISGLHETVKILPLGVRVHYFPSYELIMDELRDYRFYEADMIHPNQLAIDYVWERFAEVWMAPSAHPTMNKVDAVQRGFQHRPFNPDSEKHRDFLRSLEAKITYLQREYPFMDFP